MGRDDRMGHRLNLTEPCEMQYLTRDETKRKFEIDVLNLSSNAIATRIPRDHDITDDYGDLINGPAFIWHSHWADVPNTPNWRRGFLSIARRVNSEYWKWVFFFDRKYTMADQT